MDLQAVRLDDFHRVFTSEDNAAFEDIIKRDNERKEFKQWWIEASELKHNTLHKQYRDAIADGRDIENTGHALLGNEFKARHSLNWTPDGQAQVDLVEKPKVDFKNTRFTTAQQVELDSMLGISVANRHARQAGEQDVEAAEMMARSGRFGLGISAQGYAGMRAVGGQMDRSLLPSQEVRGYPIMSTPALLPGVGGLSPLMTYGQIGSTPRCLDEEGPSFRMNEASDREQAAEKLQRGATQKLREAKQQTKSERLRALGLTPPPSSTPRGGSSRTTPGGASSRRNTPGSTITRVSPMSPIGALIQRAQRMSQQGGRFQISNTPTPRPASEAPLKRRKKAASGAPGREKSSERLPASITDDLL